MVWVSWLFSYHRVHSPNFVQFYGSSETHAIPKDGQSSSQNVLSLSGINFILYFLPKPY